MITIKTADPVKTALLRMMLDAARELNEAGIGTSSPDHIHPEYPRGQAELICLTLGLPMTEYAEDLIRAITIPAPVAIIQENRAGQDQMADFISSVSSNALVHEDFDEGNHVFNHVVRDARKLAGQLGIGYSHGEDPDSDPGEFA